MLRANEEAAIAQAISILNSDAAFATFDKADVQKKDWCRTPDQTGEQDVNEQNLADKETDMSTLEGNIGQLQISIDDTKENIRLATEDLNMNRETQTTTTTTRKEEDMATLEGNIG